MIADRFGRRFRKLRVSLTAACNYACTYCVPDGRRLVAARDELSAVAMLRAIEMLVDVAGIEALRFTGGEPLLSEKLGPLLAGASTLGLRDLSLTTNGQLLARKLPLLRGAGIKRINVSLDTLDAAGFRLIARGGDLLSVLLGLDQARLAGIDIKINMVPMRGQNLKQVLPMLEFCLEQGFELRLIELMRMGHLASQRDVLARQFVSQQELLDLIGQRYAFTPEETPSGSTAARYRVNSQGFFGIIANESSPFCSGCDRLRLSSSGWLHGCLSSGHKHYLGDLLDRPLSEARGPLRQLLGKALADKQEVAFTGSRLIMKAVGG